jgi:8-oxo-dGTP pyrophosphatase MutT (NUDIX family)
MSRRVTTEGPPDWLEPLLAGAADIPPEELSRFLPPPEGGRESAVLILFGEGNDGPDLLLIERSSHLRSHAGQPAFPGGAVDPEDEGPADTALREAVEETGLDPAGVDVLMTLPALWLPPSGFVVTPVIAWWREPSTVSPMDAAEVAAVVRVPISELAEPAHRFLVHHPSGWLGPAFGVRDLLVWGFTAGLVDKLLLLGGWERPWNHDDVRELPADVSALALRTLINRQADPAS